ncbi:MAG: rod shape-determining protein MreC [Chitinophagales bacterium]|jgi:rod shape-determining protein MreC
MYNLVKFILKYHFTILFIIIEIIAISILFQHNQYQKVKFINASNFITGTVYETKSTTVDYFKLRDINEQLAKENAELQNKVLELNYVEIPRLYNDTVYIQDTVVMDTTRQLKFHAAKVISNSLHKQFNTIFINKGAKDHFYVDMGVINAEGLVGVVRNVSDYYATVTPIINRELNINAKIKGSGFFGNLTWDGKDPVYAQLYDIPNHISPNIGDTIVSSGYSHIFKEGYVIGYIHQVVTVPGKSFINLDVKLAVEFGNLNYVYGIENTIKESIDSLSIEN